MGSVTWMTPRMHGTTLNFGGQKAWDVASVILNPQSQCYHGVELASSVSPDGFPIDQKIGF